MNAPARNVECLVIGGGLAGAMAGLRLAAAGREVLLIEKEAAAHHKVCGEFLSVETVQYLGQAGVDPAAMGAAPIGRVRLAAGAEVAEAALPFPALSLSRRVLDEALIRRAEIRGCVVRRGVAVDQLVRNAGSWTIRLADRTTFTSDNVFLATGKHGLRGWARPAGAQSDLVGFKLHWRLAPDQIEALRGAMELFLFCGGYGGLSLVEEEGGNLCLVVQHTELRRLGGWSGLFASILEENRLLRARLGGAQAMWRRPLAVSPIPYGHLARGAAGLWAVGDQAAVIPSFTGDGMAIALHSGALAAEFFAKGQRAEQFAAALRGQLRRRMQLALTLSRAMVSEPGRKAAPWILRIVPNSMRWIAAGTRIPSHALLTVDPECMRGITEGIAPQ
jgi:flavin-dependent dehydrogenase